MKPETDVLVSTDGGRTWTLHPKVPGAPASAIARVRETNPELAASVDPLYAPLKGVRQYQVKLVESTELVAVDLDLEEEPPDA